MLATHKIRDLVLSAPPSEGRPPHVTAASGLIRSSGRIYVISDDDFILAVFSIDNDDPGEVKLLLTGPIPMELMRTRLDKADLETMTLVPSFPAAPHGGLLALGSGSTPNRRNGAFWRLDDNGDVQGEPTQIDLSDVYARISTSCSELNIEGAAVVGDSCRLLQRGNGLHGQNAVVDLHLDRVLSALAEGSAIPGSAVRFVKKHDIGDIEGVPLGFTDGSPLEDGRMVFAASAEDTTDPTKDGVVTGSSIGIVDAEGGVERIEPLAELYKIEGVHADEGDGGISLVLVADADDPSVPSPLLAADL